MSSLNLPWSGPTILPWTTGKAPSLVELNARLYLAWASEDSRICISSWQPGGSSWGLQPPVVLDKTTPETPALGVVDGELVLFWKANDATDTIYYSKSKDGARWTVSQRLEWTTPQGPSIASLNHVVYLAWTASDASRQLYLAQFDGTYLSEAQRLSGLSSEVPPALISFDGGIWILGSYGPPTHQLFYSSPAAGGGWNPPTGLTEYSAHRPGLAAQAKKLYVAWADRSTIPTTSRIRISLYDGASGAWQGAQEINETSDVTPALAILGSRLYMAWTPEGASQSIRISSAQI